MSSKLTGGSPKVYALSSSEPEVKLRYGSGRKRTMINQESPLPAKAKGWGSLGRKEVDSKELAEKQGFEGRVVCVCGFCSNATAELTTVSVLQVQNKVLPWVMLATWSLSSVSVTRVTR